MSGAFIVLTGAMWVFIFTAMFYSAVVIEKAAVQWLSSKKHKET